MDLYLIQRKYLPILKGFLARYWLPIAAGGGLLVVVGLIVYSWPNDKRESRVPRAPNLTFSLSGAPFFEAGGELPTRFCRDGANFSPPLEIVKPPIDAAQFAIVFESVAEGEAEPMVHWVLYNVPATTTNLPEGIPAEPRLQTPPDALQGTNSFGGEGYAGPFSDGRGGRRFVFRLYAMREALPKRTRPGLTWDEVRALIQPSVIATTELGCDVK